jgi:hypothetical protein
LERSRTRERRPIFNRLKVSRVLGRTSSRAIAWRHQETLHAGSEVQQESDIKGERRKEKEVEEVKPKPQRKERAKSATRPRRAAAPKPKPSANGKEKVIVIDDPEKETQGALTRAQLEIYQSRWKTINASNRLSEIHKQEIRIMAARLGILTESRRGFQNVSKSLYDKLNERFGTNFSVKKLGIPMRR